MTRSTSSLLRYTPLPLFSLFFFNDTATTEIYTLSLHDALPTYAVAQALREAGPGGPVVIADTQDNPGGGGHGDTIGLDRKSTRLNSSHVRISYAVFCLKKKKKRKQHNRQQHTTPK